MNPLKRKLPIAVLVLVGGISLCAFGLWRYRSVRAIQTPHVGFLVDSSASAGIDCACLEELVLQAPAAAHLTAASTLSILQTGNRASANEPVQVAEYTLPAFHTIVENREKTATAQKRLLHDLRQSCQGLSQTDRSPIFQAIGRSVEHLKAKACGPGTNCRLYVLTDGEELIDPHIRQALRSTEDLAQMTLPSPIHNEGISIVFVGIAQTKGQGRTAAGQRQPYTRDRNLQTAGRLEAVWRKVFVQPELISFAPFCRPGRDATGTGF